MTTTKTKTRNKKATPISALKKPKKAAAGHAAKATKQAPAKKAPTKASTRKPGALDSAARVLAETNKPMTSREMIEAMAAKGYWKSPAGKTPQATLYSAILREITTKGKDARFTKTERGRFALAR